MNLENWLKAPFFCFSVQVLIKSGLLSFLKPVHQLPLVFYEDFRVICLHLLSKQQQTIYCLCQTNYNTQLNVLQAIQSQSVSTNDLVKAPLRTHISISIGLIILNHCQVESFQWHGHSACTSKQGKQGKGERERERERERTYEWVHGRQ